MKASSRGCGTCKDRRISCDRGRPVCLNCSRTNRQCKGYELRLSWPRPDDRKRAMLGRVTDSSKVAMSQLRMMNTSTWDIEIHYYLTASGFGAPPTMPKPISWSPVRSSADYDLLQYFDTHTSESLVSIQPSLHSPGLRDILMRVALSQSLPSSSAVLQALLALSSLHRYGLQTRVAQLKISAISGLAASAKNGVIGDDVIAHVAALMLLCCFEIQQVSETSSQWVQYISSVKNVLRTVGLVSFERSSDMAALLYWVSYHDVLSRFSLQYWNHGSLEGELLQIAPDDVDILVKQTTLLEAWNPSLICPRIFEVVKEVLNTARYNRGSYDKNILPVLEWKIRGHLLCKRSQLAALDETFMDDEQNQELFTLALLIYVERWTGAFAGQSAIMRSRLDSAFAILSQLKIVLRQWPVLIIAAEARTDEDRMVVIDLITRTEESSSGGRLTSLKAIIQSLWAQDDLAERELGYADKLEAVISSSRILPSFI